MELSKKAVLAEIKAGLAGAQQAIRNHPPETVATYQEGLRAFLEGQEGADPTDAAAAATAVGLGVEDLKMVRLYLVTMAFMAAWYHLHGDKSRRDAAAHSAATLVGGTGIDPENAFKEFLNHERLWRSALEAHGIGRRAGVGCAAIVLLVTMSAGALLLR
jgi:hypothetical protein